MRVHRTWPDLLRWVDAREALAVVAHPDDESFGLGAVLAALAQRGVRVRLVCLTHGEASTLGGAHDLGEVRARELRDAAVTLGVASAALLDHPDGHLADVPVTALDHDVRRHVGTADLMVVLDPSGVTGHPDHRAATAAAQRVARRLGIPVLAWGVAPRVAASLNEEFGTAFVGMDGDDVIVDRSVQLEAIACHRSQSRENPVMRRRLALQRDRERVRLCTPATRGTFAPTPEGMHGVQ